VDEVIFVELLGRRGRAVQRTRIDSFPATIGRALTSDVVIDDIYVSPRHANLVIDDEGQLHLEDAQSTNGIHPVGSRERTSRLALRTGDVVRIGHSLLRFRSPRARVPEAVIDDFEHGQLRRALAAPSFAILMGLVALGALALNLWLEDFDRVKPEGLMFDASYMLLIIAAWAMLWSLASRFGSRDFDFVSHFSFACVVGVLSLAIGVATQYYEFILSPLRTMGLVEFGAEVGVLCILLFGHLSIASRLRRLHRIGLAMLVVLPLAGLAELNESRYDAEFDVSIHFPSQLKPIPPSWIPARTMSEFFDGTNALESALDALVEEGEDG